MIEASILKNLTVPFYFWVIYLFCCIQTDKAKHISNSSQIYILPAKLSDESLQKPTMKVNPSRYRPRVIANSFLALTPQIAMARGVWSQENKCRVEESEFNSCRRFSWACFYVQEKKRIYEKKRLVLRTKSSWQPKQGVSILQNGFLLHDTWYWSSCYHGYQLEICNN